MTETRIRSQIIFGGEYRIRTYAPIAGRGISNPLY
jgi:hypothetical protein